MTEMPKRRQSIRPDDGLNLDNESNEDLLPCEDCNSMFAVYKSGTELKLEEDKDIEDFKNLQKKKKREVDTDLSTPTKFKCKSCKSAAEAARHAEPERTIWRIAIIVLLGGILCWQFQDDIVFYLKRYKSIPVKNMIESNADKLLEEGLIKLETLYKNQIEETWITLSSGIKSVVRENKPSMFLMIYDSDYAGNTAECISKAVSKHAIFYLMKKMYSPEIVYGAELDEKWLLDDPGLLLKQLKRPVEEKGALVVINLHEVPAKVAQMFHYVCDRYSPFVEKAVTFFTLKVDVMPSQKDLQKKVEQTMNDLWSSVLEDSHLRPLITRMTSNIIRIYPESGCYEI